MPWFVTIGYGDEAGYHATGEPARLTAHRHDTELTERGAIIGAAGAPVQVRNHDGAQLQTTAGPYLNSALPLAGFGLIEAATMEDAIALAAGTPCAVAHGVVEVWPLLQGPA